MVAGKRRGAGLVARGIVGWRARVERQWLMAAIGVHLGATCACAAVYKVRARGAGRMTVGSGGVGLLLQGGSR